MIINFFPALRAKRASEVPSKVINANFYSLIYLTRHPKNTGFMGFQRLKDNIRTAESIASLSCISLDVDNSPYPPHLVSKTIHFDHIWYLTSSSLTKNYGKNCYSYRIILPLDVEIPADNYSTVVHDLLNELEKTQAVHLPYLKSIDKGFSTSIYSVSPCPNRYGKPWKQNETWGFSREYGTYSFEHLEFTEFEQLELEWSLTDTLKLLNYISPQSYDSWIAVGIALSNEYGEDAFDIWKDWSLTTHKSFTHHRKVWSSFSVRKPTLRKAGLFTIIKLARENGASIRFSNNIEQITTALWS